MGKPNHRGAGNSRDRGLWGSPPLPPFQSKIYGVTCLMPIFLIIKKCLARASLLHTLHPTTTVHHKQPPEYRIHLSPRLPKPAATFGKFHSSFLARKHCTPLGGARGRRVNLKSEILTTYDFNRAPAGCLSLPVGTTVPSVWQTDSFNHSSISGLVVPEDKNSLQSLPQHHS